MTKYFLGIEIEINHHCNLACTYCPNSNTERINKGLMSLENFRVIMNQLKDINYEGKISYHFYNEPMLHPELESFVKLSKEILPKSQSEIFTNGVYLNPERYETLRNAGVDRFTVTKHKGLSKIAFEETYNNLSPEEKVRNQFFDYSKLVYTNRGNLVDFGKKLDQPSKKMCLIPTCALVVTVNGNVVTCYEDYQEKTVMGNVFEEHIKDIWTKPEYQSFREDLKQGFRYKHEVCKTCNNLKVIV